MRSVVVLLLALSLFVVYVPDARADHGSDLSVLASSDNFAEAPISPELGARSDATEEPSEAENPGGESTANKVVLGIILLGFIAAVIIVTGGAGAAVFGAGLL